MKKIKIAQIITRMDWAGSPDILRMICRGLPGEAYDLTLISGPTRFPSRQTREFLQDFPGSRLIILPCLRRDINPFFDLPAFFRLYAILAKGKFDIVHTHTAKAGALARPAARLAGCRCIIHMPHGHNFYGYFNPLFEKLIILAERFLSGFTDKFMVLSELEKIDLIKFKVAAAQRITVVSSGLDLDFKKISHDSALEKRKEFGFTPGQMIVGMVSRLEPVKGPVYFVRACAELQKKYPQLRFIIVGDGSLRPQLEKLAGRLNLQEKLVFTGWREDCLEIIAFLDILAQPSLNEAIGRVLLEAQGLGVPVVATKVGGIPEVVKDGESGILLPQQDHQALARAISQLIDDPAKRLAMSKSAVSWIDEKFSSRKMLREIFGLYQEAMSK